VSRFCAHFLASSFSDETGPRPTCPLPATLTPGYLQWQLSVTSASSWPASPSVTARLRRDKFIVCGHQPPSHHLISMSARRRQHSQPSLSFLSPFDSLVRTTMSTQTLVPQHNNLTNTASTVTVSLSVYVRNITVILKLVSSLLTRRYQQKVCPGRLSGLRFPTIVSRYPSIHSETSTSHASQTDILRDSNKLRRREVPHLTRIIPSV
jgi:hypothetical protein